VLALLKRKLDRQAWLAVCAGDDAVAMARVRRSRETAPVLEACVVQPSDSVSIQGAELSRIGKSMDLDRYPGTTTLPLGSYSLVSVEAPDVLSSELRAAVRWRVKDLIDFHIDDAVIDVFEVPDQKATGRNRMMYAVVVRAGVIRQHAGLLTGAGLNLEVIDIPELALRNIVSLLPEDVAGVACLYLSNHSGLIVLTRQGTLYLSRRLDIGWEQLGSSVEAAETRLDRIVVEIQRSLDYYESHFMQAPIGSVVMTPLPDPLLGVDGYLADQLGLPVRTIDINSVIDVEEPLGAYEQCRAMLAVGAALRQEGRAL
jgi:MSHA biogenesis protein MshI